MTPKEVENSLFGKYKYWEQLTPKSWSQFSQLIEKLMGTNVEDRRKFIFNKVDFDNIKFL